MSAPMSAPDWTESTAGELMPESTAELNTGESEGGEEVNSAPPSEATSQATLDESKAEEPVILVVAPLVAGQEEGETEVLVNILYKVVCNV